MNVERDAITALSAAWDEEPPAPSLWDNLTMCSTCGCCSIGRMGTCVGGCGPRGGRSRHDRSAAAERGPLEPLPGGAGVFR